MINHANIAKIITETVASVITELVKPPFSYVTREQAAGYLETSTSNIDSICRNGRKLKDGTLVIPKKNHKGQIRFCDLIVIKKHGKSAKPI